MIKNKYRKVVGIFVLFILIFISLPHRVYADTAQSDINILCDDAHGLFSNEIDGISLEKVIPGDMFERYMTLKNQTKNTQLLYLKIEGSKDDQVFAKLINLEITYKNELIYNSSMDEVMQETYLGNYEPGEEGKLKIKLTFTEKAGNEVNIANTKAVIIFSAEEVIPEAINTGSVVSNNPFLLLISGATIVMVILYKKRKRESNEKS